MRKVPGRDTADVGAEIPCFHGGERDMFLVPLVQRKAW